jgi:hypothetical protein
MTGSRRWFGYTGDSGTKYAIEQDESVAESVALALGAVAEGAIPINATGRLPIRCRYINVFKVVDDITIRRRFIVGTIAAFTAIEAARSATIDGALWSVSSTVGERRKVIPLTDSEQLDGDLDSN